MRIVLYSFAVAYDSPAPPPDPPLPLRTPVIYDVNMQLEIGPVDAKSPVARKFHQNQFNNLNTVVLKTFFRFEYKVLDYSTATVCEGALCAADKLFYIRTQIDGDEPLRIRVFLCGAGPPSPPLACFVLEVA
ncbi:hypothetical protein EVAR_74287_1 [Eumeta japonica]|uniref:Uncharacterized protein n=1 Tax=Eumeta variegata TaxID=151549 RepID=A0A4C1SCL4_EUMVA|nr:hypothetical protein EVAR_74287_1 [Eumeta japonica]